MKSPTTFMQLFANWSRCWALPKDYFKFNSIWSTNVIASPITLSVIYNTKLLKSNCLHLFFLKLFINLYSKFLLTASKAYKNLEIFKHQSFMLKNAIKTYLNLWLGYWKWWVKNTRQETSRRFKNMIKMKWLMNT